MCVDPPTSSTSSIAAPGIFFANVARVRRTISIQRSSRSAVISSNWVRLTSILAAAPANCSTTGLLSRTESCFFTSSAFSATAWRNSVSSSDDSVVFASAAKRCRR